MKTNPFYDGTKNDLSYFDWKNRALACWNAKPQPCCRHPFGQIDFDRSAARILESSFERFLLEIHHPRSAKELAQLDDFLEKLLQGFPQGYLEGSVGFWDFTLEVTPDVLIPRPDSEVLIEAAARCWLPEARLGKRWLEWGSGSGNLALALASLSSAWTILSLEKSEAARKVALRNQKKLSVSSKQLSFSEGDWWWPEEKLHAWLGHAQWDGVISNPPYLSPEAYHKLSDQLLHEPRMALVSDNSGMKDAQRIAILSMVHLKPGGFLLLEHGAAQQGPWIQMLTSMGYQVVKRIKDGAHRPRALLMQRPE